MSIWLRYIEEVTRGPRDPEKMRTFRGTRGPTRVCSNEVPDSDVTRGVTRGGGAAAGEVWVSLMIGPGALFSKA